MNVKTILATLFVVVAVTLVSGCTTSGALYDCGTDIDCFYEHAETCSGAKVMVQEPMNDEGTATAATYMEIQGGTPDACDFYMRIDDISTSSSDPFVEMTIEMLSILEGKDLLCTLTSEEIVESWPISNEEILQKCSGSMIDMVSGGEYTFSVS